jgi:cell wall-associated NlpC family hydrolase
MNLLGGRLRADRIRTAAARLSGRTASHALVLGLAVGVATTATVTPVQRAVNQAFESFAIEDPATGEAAFALAPELVDQPFFPPPQGDVLNALKPRPSILAHVVQAGDTVVKLADKYRVTPNTIVWANNLTNPDRLPVGHALLILPMSGVLYDVKQGDTIESVATKFQIEPEMVADANGLALGKTLLPNDQLVIPGGRPLEPERPEPATRSVDRTDPSAGRQTPGAPATTQLAPPPAPAAPPPVPTPMRPTTYEVAEGDSIVSISRRFNVSTGTIALANGLTGTAADSIKVGQKLIVPPVDGVMHKVGDGDTVRDLAAYYGVDTGAIIKANLLPEPYVLLPGQTLLIPNGKVPDPPPPTPAPPPEPTPLAYTVAEGDSLIAIADRYGVDARVIARYNGLERSDLIAPGQNLLLPGAQPRAASTGGAAPRSAPAPAPAPAPAAPAARVVQSPLQAAAALVAPIVRPAAPTPAPKPVVPAADNWGLVGVASKFLGSAYVWGGQSPRGFDCTGFTWYVYQQLGRSIPLHDLWGQMQSGPRVSRTNLQAGDLVFFANTYMAGLSHVGIYIGGGRFIHAGSERTGVTVSSLSDAYWSPRYYGATRPW